MKIGLVSNECRDRDPGFNLKQVEARMVECGKRGFDLICFGESFAQGFECLTWNCKRDLRVALAQDDARISRLRESAVQNRIGLSMGYIEKEHGRLYSSYLFIGSNGQVINNFRRRSTGWKERAADPERYREGDNYTVFTYAGMRFATAVCGDLWNDRFLEDMQSLSMDVVLWPLYIDFSEEVWERKEKNAYARRVAGIHAPVLMINSYVDIADRAKGGCLVIEGGRITHELPMGRTGVLSCEI